MAVARHALTLRSKLKVKGQGHTVSCRRGCACRYDYSDGAVRAILTDLYSARRQSVRHVRCADRDMWRRR